MDDDDDVVLVAGVDPPSCFFNIRNRAGLFLNNRLTCVAECLERMLVTRGVLLKMFDDDDDEVVMAKKFAWPIRPMAGVLLAADLTAPKRRDDIFLLLLIITVSMSIS